MKVSEKAIELFLREVWKESGSGDEKWPVNAYSVGEKHFGEPVGKSVRNVLVECDERGFFKTKPTLEGDIHGLSDAGKTYIGVK